MEEKEKETELVKRIKKLKLKSLRVALFSIKDPGILEEAVKAGEEYNNMYP